jgi:hypothetical protein
MAYWAFSIKGSEAFDIVMFQWTLKVSPHNDYQLGRKDLQSPFDGDIPSKTPAILLGQPSLPQGSPTSFSDGVLLSAPVACHRTTQLRTSLPH